MDNKLFINMCNKINYDTYIKIKRYLAVQALSFGAASQIIEFQNPSDTLTLSLIGLASAVGASTLYELKGEQYTKDLSEIRELYKLFLEKYTNLNRAFSLENPIEIYTLFNYLLYGGYLSKNHKFRFEEQKECKNPIIFGAIIFSGKGVCRHAASLLTDILSSYEISSYNLPVCLDHSESSVIERIIGNHLITASYYDGKAYYLDPTHKNIYSRIEEEILLYDKKYGSIPLYKTTMFNNNKERKELKQHLSNNYKCETKEEIKKLKNNAKKTYNKNRDIFEEFYKDNSELYDEVTNKMIKMRVLKTKK